MPLNEKPTIESMVSYLKSAIQGCEITEAEVDELRQLYPNVTFRDLNRVFHGAVNSHAMQPISYMVRQLNVLRPPSDPFNSQISQQGTHNWQGQKIESGMDWDAIDAEMARKKALEKQAYDQKHGKGAYDKMVADDLNQLHQFFVDLERKTFPPVEEEPQETKPKTAEDIKADKEVDKLINDTLELLDRREKAKKEKKKPKPAIPKHKTINLRERKAKLQAQLREAEQRG